MNYRTLIICFVVAFVSQSSPVFPQRYDLTLPNEAQETEILSGEIPPTGMQTESDESFLQGQPFSDDGTEVDSGWWSQFVSQPMRNSSQTKFISLDEVLVQTLNYSNQVKVFADLPLIRRTAIIEADALFDWTRYFETRWDDLNDPVGNTLTVGGTGTRYINQQWTAGSGIRRRNLIGGEVDLRQNIGYQETNSIFFEPNPQGTARLILGYTQPLMRGRGRVYNESLICLAQLDAKIADEEFRRQLQTHLLEVTRAYWALYMERGVLFQKMNSFERAQEIYTLLEKRRDIDAQEAADSQRPSFGNQPRF